MIEWKAGSNMLWRLIPPERNDAFMNMALDEAAMRFIGKGFSFPTIRFYEWKNSAVVIGYFQRLHEEVNVDACKKLGIDIVRRSTGGGAMYLDEHGEITFSVIVPEKMLYDINASYKEVCGWLINGLRSMGISAEFRPINDVVVDGRKISGSAMTRKHGASMVHGTLLYDVDPERMFSVLRVPREKIADKNIQNIKKAVTCVKEHRNISKGTLRASIVEAFVEDKDFEILPWSTEELAVAMALVKDKYTTKEWIFMR